MDHNYPGIPQTIFSMQWPENKHLLTTICLMNGQFETLKLSKLAHAITLSTCTREMSGSILGPNTDNSDRCHPVFLTPLIRFWGSIYH